MGEVIRTAHASFSSGQVPAIKINNIGMLVGAGYSGYLLSNTVDDEVPSFLQQLKDKLEELKEEEKQLTKRDAEADADKNKRRINEKRLRKSMEDADANKREAKQQLELIGKKLKQMEGGSPEDKKLRRKIIRFAGFILKLPVSAIGLNGTIDEFLAAWIIFFGVLVGYYSINRNSFQEFWDDKKKSLEIKVQKLLGISPPEGDCYCGIVYPALCSHCGSPLPDYSPQEPGWWKKFGRADAAETSTPMDDGLARNRD